jgi:hypothetical protein
MLIASIAASTVICGVLFIAVSALLGLVLRQR